MSIDTQHVQEDIAIALSEEDLCIICYVLRHSAIIPVLPLLPRADYERMEDIAARIETQRDHLSHADTQAAQASPRERLVAARKAHRLSQAEVANRFGISTCAVSRWERGTSTPTRHHRRKLAQLFGMSEEALGFE